VINRCGLRAAAARPEAAHWGCARRCACGRFRRRKQFSDEVVLAPTVVGLRRRFSVTVDSKLAKDQARVTILKSTGERSSVFVEHAIGSLENPMSDRMI